MNNATLINQHSGKTDYGTPEYILDAANRVFFHRIDLDPASNYEANKLVKAKDIFTEPCLVPTVNPVNDDLPTYQYHGSGGLESSWFGNVWLNPPFQKPEKACKEKCTKKTCRKRGYHIGQDVAGIGAWVDMAVNQYSFGNLEQLLIITFASTSEGWFQPLHNYPQCYINGRVNYLDELGNVVKGVTKGSVVTYLGLHTNRFARAFKPLGSVKIPIL